MNLRTAYNIRMFFRISTIIFLGFSLFACGERGLIRFAPVSEGAKVERIFFASNRALATHGYTTGVRSSRITYGQIDIAVPPDREVGSLTYPSKHGKIDGNRAFVATDLDTFADGNEFESRIRQALRDDATGQKDVVVYVHGYNNNFTDTTFRFAQIAHDVNVDAVNVAIDWPSAAKPLNYLYDKDSLLFSRDGMVTALDGIRDAGARSIVIIAHSMGAELTMEALRSLALSKNHATLDRIGGVILISGDIDTQIFRRAAKEIGDLPQPFILMVSKKDPALGLSAKLTGRRSRIGNLQNLDKVDSLDLTVVDVSSYASPGVNRHFLMGTSPALLKLISGAGGVVRALEDGKGELSDFARTFGSEQR